MTKLDYNFMKELPEKQVLKIGNADTLYISHVEPEKQEREDLKKKNISYVLVGHSHIDEVIYKDGICIMNPGSVGIPHLGKVGTSYGIIEWKENKWNFQSYTVTYDIKKAIDSIYYCKNISEEALIWGYFLNVSLIVGYGITPVYIREFYRIGKIYLEARQKNIEPDYSPVYEKKLTKAYKLLGKPIDQTIVPKELWWNAKKNVDYYLEKDYPETYKSFKRYDNTEYYHMDNQMKYIKM